MYLTHITFEENRIEDNILLLTNFGTQENYFKFLEHSEWTLYRIHKFAEHMFFEHDMDYEECLIKYLIRIGVQIVPTNQSRLIHYTVDHQNRHKLT